MLAVIFLRTYAFSGRNKFVLCILLGGFVGIVVAEIIVFTVGIHGKLLACAAL
jgi:hypothetical protein